MYRIRKTGLNSSPHPVHPVNPVKTLFFRASLAAMQSTRPKSDKSARPEEERFPASRPCHAVLITPRFQWSAELKLLSLTNAG
jgi:hypothetical protein